MAAIVTAAAAAALSNAIVADVVARCTQIKVGALCAVEAHASYALVAPVTEHVLMQDFLAAVTTATVNHWRVLLLLLLPPLLPPLRHRWCRR
jgi:hypothetical protein